MKSLSDLKAIRDRMQKQINLRETSDHQTSVVVGMATCGIAAGARPVLNAFLEEIDKRNLQHISVTQTGCVGMCALEPIVEIHVPGQETVTYVNMTPAKVVTVVSEHLANGHVVAEYTIGKTSYSK